MMLSVQTFEVERAKPYLKIPLPNGIWWDRENFPPRLLVNMLYLKSDIADVVKMTNQLTLKQGDYPG